MTQAQTDETQTTGRCVLLDLDGTLTDSRPGIIGSTHHALRFLGHTPDPAQDLTWIIGPPLETVIARVLAHYGDTRTSEAVAEYRRHYSEVGLLQNTMYPGIPEALHRLRDDGNDLVLATAKRTHLAIRVIEHFGLTKLFRGIYGSEGAGVLDQKPELVAHILAREKPSCAIMVGDRRYDIVGAHANHLRAIGVAWGYGGVAELTDAGADAMAERPDQLADLVRAEMPEGVAARE